MRVVQQRRHPGEAYRTKQLFLVQLAVCLAKLRVPLVWNISSL